MSSSSGSVHHFAIARRLGFWPTCDAGDGVLDRIRARIWRSERTPNRMNKPSVMCRGCVGDNQGLLQRAREAWEAVHHSRQVANSVLDSSAPREWRRGSLRARRFFLFGAESSSASKASGHGAGPKTARTRGARFSWHSLPRYPTEDVAATSLPSLNQSSTARLRPSYEQKTVFNTVQECCRFPISSLLL
jgi:hypothetical protein